MGVDVETDSEVSATIRGLDPLRADHAETLRASGLVLTPGGFRDPSLVHRVERDVSVRHSDKQMVLQNRRTGAERAVTESARPLFAARLGSGWIAYAGWANDSGKTVSIFRARWRVPPHPATQGAQTIFLFNGINPASTGDAILQPVLQWGSSAAGGGPYWSLMSWYVQGDGKAFHTDEVRVDTGDELIGLMRLINHGNGLFSYTAEFESIPGTALHIQDVPELVWCNVILEAYSISRCSDYPETDRTLFSSIGLTTQTSVTPTWALSNRVTDCGQHVEKIGSDLSIYYQ